MTPPMCLNKSTKEDLKKILDSVDHVFSDCDGVIWMTAALPGSGDFFKLIQKLGKTVHYVSNNSIRTKENYAELFEAAGLKNGYDRLTTPSVAIAEYLKSVNFDKQIYCISCSETVRILESYGFKCKTGPDIGVDDYRDFTQYLTDDPEIGAVVFDSDFKVNLPKLYKAIAYLKRPEVLFISGASDRHVLMPGCLTLGTGVFTELAKQESNREPLGLGKPGKLFGEFAMRRANVTDPSRVLFIGDMMEQDIALGKALGFKTLLVLTNSTEQDIKEHKTIQPDYYATCLGDLVPYLQKLI